VTLNEWATESHATAYLSRPDVRRRAEGEATLWELLPSAGVGRALDLGTGDGRLLARVRDRCPFEAGVAVDFSPTMLAAARARFDRDPSVAVVEHNLSDPLPAALGRFDLVVSSFAIHHLSHERKRALYAEVFALLTPGGWFCNLEHVASPTATLHDAFYELIGGPDDPANQLLGVATQLEWLREIGFVDVDCFWKWRELALLAGRTPAAS